MANDNTREEPESPSEDKTQDNDARVDEEKEPPPLRALQFPRGSEYSRGYGTIEAAPYLGKTDSALRSLINRERRGRDDFEISGIQFRRVRRNWIVRFHCSWK